MNRTQVLTLSRQNPGLTPAQISDLTGVSVFNVKDILDNDKFELTDSDLIDTWRPMLKGLRVSEIQCAERYTGTLWGGDAE